MRDMNLNFLELATTDHRQTEQYASVGDCAATQVIKAVSLYLFTIGGSRTHLNLTMEELCAKKVNVLFIVLQSFQQI